MTGNILVVPGFVYGIHGELIPNCRSVDAMWAIMEEWCTVLKLPTDITDDDQCQRGPDGKPLCRVTPFVPYETLAEWRARGQES